jgi:hypothetical protein
LADVTMDDDIQGENKWNLKINSQYFLNGYLKN